MCPKWAWVAFCFEGSLKPIGVKLSTPCFPILTTLATCPGWSFCFIKNWMTMKKNDSRTGDQIRRWAWLLEMLGHSLPLTFDEINERWQHTYLSGGEPMTKQMLKRDREAIAEAYGFEVVCQKNNGFRYTLEDSERLYSDDMELRMLQVISVTNVLNDGTKLGNKLMTEIFPMGVEHLMAVSDALNNDCEMKIRYQSFKSKVMMDHEVQPYLLKVYRRRFYLYGKLLSGKHKDEGICLALDRMHNIIVTPVIFPCPKVESLQEAFVCTVGATLYDDSKIETVQVRAWGYLQDYLTTLPFVETQRMVSRGEGWTLFEWRVRLNYEFYQELFHEYEQLEVVGPPEVREQVRQRAMAMAARHEIIKSAG